MNELTMNTKQTISPTQDIKPALFTDFVKWIDRNEKTTQTYLTNLKQFAAWMKYRGIKRPERADIISYRDWLQTEHEGIRLDPGSAAGWTYRTDSTGEPIKITCKPNTTAQYLRSVSQFFRWTAANGIYPDIAANIHAPKISHNTHRKEALEAQDVQAIEKSIETRTKERTAAAGRAEKDAAGKTERSTEQGKRLYAMYELTVTAGLRVIELHRANIKDFVTKGGQSWLYVWGKGHTEPDQKKPIAAEVAEAITDYLDCRKDKKTGTSPLFVSTGNRSGGKRIATSTISKMLKQAMKDAGYNSDRLTAHSLRHTAGTACMELTGNIYTTQKYMRHSNPATTEIYLHNETEKTETDIAERLYGLFHGEPAIDTGRDKLKSIIENMDATQVEKLTAIAEMIAK